MSVSLSEHLPLLAEAPDGIKKLRGLIYELAARGFLAEADSETPAKIVRMGEVAEFVMGQAPPGSECNTNGVGTAFVKTGEFGERYPVIREWTTRPLKFAKDGDVLICVVGATVGKLNLGIDCAIGRSVAAIRPSNMIATSYLYVALVPFTLQLRAQSRGSAQGVIGKSELGQVTIRLPPLAEQHRIVAKVDELMALCDRMEAEQADAEAAHATLVQTLLGTLTQSCDAAELAANWQRLSQHFDTLFTTEASLDALKQTILQLAVMGKLVPQESNDEPASELLKRIAAEKARLVGERRIRKDKPLAAIGLNENPFELPKEWEWCRLGDLTLLVTDGTHHTPTYQPTGIAFISVKDIDGNTVSFSDCKFIPESEHQQINQRCNPERDDILLCRIGTLGRPTIVDTDRPFSLFVSVGLLKLPKTICLTPYIHKVLSSPLLASQYEEIKAGGSHTNKLNLGDIPTLRIPLPPIAEQHRIVAKVDELIALYDSLKADLAESRARQARLASTLIESALQAA